MELSLYLFQLLNGLALGMVLFTLSAGLSLVFGIAGVINLSHGGFYLLGGYMGYSFLARGGDFWLALALVPLVAAALGALTERLFLRKLYQLERHMDQALTTFGLAFVLADGTRWLWGATILSVPPPPALAGVVEIGGFFYPSYRLFVIGAGVVLALGMAFVLRRTRWGAAIRAAAADPLMAASLGVPTGRVFLWTFAGGAALAAFGGLLGAPIIALAPGLDFTMLLLAMVVVVTGGLGRVEGAFWSSLLVGMVDAFGKMFIPRLAIVLIFVLMALVLAVRPQGLLAGRG